MRRARQSNRPEICPVDGCALILRNRAAAVSHYRAHARRGELEQRGTTGEGCMDWRLLDQAHIAHAWWSHGPAFYYGVTAVATYGREFRAQVLRRAMQRSAHATQGQPTPAPVPSSPTDMEQLRLWVATQEYNRPDYPAGQRAGVVTFPEGRLYDDGSGTGGIFFEPDYLGPAGGHSVSLEEAKALIREVALEVMEVWP